jgi:chaperonin GroES
VVLKVAMFFQEFFMKKIRPLYDRILVERIQEDEKTPGGIVIPSTAKEKAQIGKVLAVGAGRVTPEGTLVPLAVKVGDQVFFAKYAGTEAGENQIIIREEDVLGIVEQ